MAGIMMYQIGMHTVVAHAVDCASPSPPETYATVGHITDLIVLYIDTLDVAGSNAERAPVLVGYICDEIIGYDEA